LPYADAYSDLVETMLSLCKPDGMVLLTYQVREGKEREGKYRIATPISGCYF